MMRSQGSPWPATSAAVAESRPLTLEQAVPLAHAFAAQVARAAACRVLFIKGPIAQSYGLRRRRRSADVDVWVDPARFATYLEALGRHGWTPRSSVEGPRILGHHSKSLIHQHWPCDIDVHMTYPGFLIPDDAALFDYLWQRRRPVSVAGVEIPGGGRIGTAAVVALHALRDPRAARNERELEYLADQLRRHRTDEESAALFDLARFTWSMDSLGPLLDAVGVERPERPNDTAYLDLLRGWTLRARQNTPTTSWLVCIRRSPWTQRPKTVWDALFLPGELLTEIHPEVGPKPMERARARVARLGRGARAFPAAVVGLARTRPHRRAT